MFVYTISELGDNRVVDIIMSGYQLPDFVLEAYRERGFVVRFVNFQDVVNNMRRRGE